MLIKSADTTMERWFDTGRASLGDQHHEVAALLEIDHLEDLEVPLEIGLGVHAREVHAREALVHAALVPEVPLSLDPTAMYLVGIRLDDGQEAVIDFVAIDLVTVTALHDDENVHGRP